jgi:GT2 family glycosyltransferase
VVIPVHGKWHLTEACLRSVSASGDRTPFEIVVVDDCSPDETADRLAEMVTVRHVRTPHNVGFVGACNLGAEMARGELLVFLNNDTLVHPRWLDHLVDAFDDPLVGVAGSMLLGEDGRVQESGSIIFADGCGWNFGRGESVDFAAVRVARDVAYCSGASLAVRRSLFADLGGFDRRFAPAYYEDTDLCFAAREAGYRVVVRPLSRVTHVEGASNGADGEGGLKRFQRVNRTTFLHKWRGALANQGTHQSSVDVWRMSHHGAAGMVLVVEPIVPTPDRDSGSRRMWGILGELIELGYAVYYAVSELVAIEPYRTEMERRGITVLENEHEQQRFLEEAGGGLDAVFLCRPDTAWRYLDRVNRHAPTAKLVYDTVDLHALRMVRQAEFEQSDEGRDQAQLVWIKEQAAILSADVTLVVSEMEREWLTSVVPTADVRVLSNIHAAVDRSPDLTGRRDVMFVGSYLHPPNVDAARWAATEILPLVRERVPDATLHLLGSYLPEDMKALGIPGVNGVGWAADLAPWYRRSRVVLAPLRYGAGVKGKVAEAVEYGVPVVGTSIAFEAMGFVDGVDVLCADTAAGLASHVVMLLSDDDRWRAIAGRGQAVLDERFSAKAARRVLEDILSERPRRPRVVEPALSVATVHGLNGAT